VGIDINKYTVCKSKEGGREEEGRGGRRGREVEGERGKL
jgi:hypothetical protein